MLAHAFLTVTTADAGGKKMTCMRDPLSSGARLGAFTNRSVRRS
jgi:hypothetical protein